MHSVKTQLCFLKNMTASAMTMAGAVFFCGALALWAAPAMAKTVALKTEGDYRYLSSNGMPYYAVAKGSAGSIKAQDYLFRFRTKPQQAPQPTPWSADMFFGVALDGVPIDHAVIGFFSQTNDWPMRKKTMDVHGGFLSPRGAYIYSAPPVDLMKKEFSHIGYAADGFPIYISKTKSFKTSYKLKEGNRPDSVDEPGGFVDGTFVRDYHYVKGAGVLDECNGALIKGKHYIYVITRDTPHVPLCWKGTPDESFKKALDNSRNAKATDLSAKMKTKKKVSVSDNAAHYKALRDRRVQKKR